MALPVSKNLNIYEGDTFRFVFRLRQQDLFGEAGAPVNLSGSIVRSQIRPAENSETVLAEFTATHNDDGGEVTLMLTPAVTASLVDGVWDAQVQFPDGTVRTYLKGTVTVNQEVTRV